jgi:hypothetical protein
MKIRNIIYAVAAMTFAACSSENLDTPQVPLTINATIDGVATRAEVTSFISGDIIGVYAGGKEDVRFDTSDGKNFSISLISDTKIYFTSDEMDVEAYYPYSDYGSFSTTDQDEITDYLYAKGTASAATGNADLVFTHLLSKLTINFSLGDGYSSPTIGTGMLTSISVTGLKTNGTFTRPGTIAINDNTEDAMTPEVSDATAKCLVIPQSVESFTLTATYDGNEYAATVPVKGGELLANKNYIYNVKIDKEKLTVSSSSAISAWDEKKSDDAVDVVYSGDVTSTAVVTTDHGE